MTIENFENLNPSHQALEKALSIILILRKKRQANAESFRNAKHLEMRKAQDHWQHDHCRSRIAKFNYTAKLEKQCEQNIGRPLPMQHLIAWRQSDEKARQNIDLLHSQVKALKQEVVACEQNYTISAEVAKTQMRETEKLQWIMENLETIWP